MTQKTILDAKLKGEEIKDGMFQTACSNAVLQEQWSLEISMIKKVKLLHYTKTNVCTICWNMSGQNPM